jgi:hypothetical protein
MGHSVEHGTADVGNPQRGKTEFLQFGGGLGDLRAIALPQL